MGFLEGFLRCGLYFGILGVLSHYIGEALPRNWFRYDKFPYREYRWEKGGQAYDFLRISEWKDKVPDMSRVVKKMVPKRLGRTMSSATVFTLITETCVAEMVHFILMILSLPTFLFWPGWGGFVCTLLLVFGNLPFLLIQRYNRPGLVRLALRLKEREERIRKSSENTAD